MWTKILKKKIFNLLIWVMNKIDSTQISRCCIGTDLYIDMTNYIPDDNKWHKVRYVLEYNIMVGENTKKKQEIYIDDFTKIMDKT